MLVKWGKNRGRVVAGDFWRKGGRLPCFALPFLAACAIHLRHCKEWMKEAYGMGCDCNDDSSCIQNGRYISLWGKSHTDIRNYHVYTIVVHAANYLCYSWVYVVFGAGGEATSLSLFLSTCRLVLSLNCSHTYITKRDEALIAPSLISVLLV